MAQLLDSSLDTFRADFTGRTFAPGDADYDTARSLWNGGIDRRPALIARCSTADDVATALRFARAQGLEVAVRGGGHSFAGFSSCNGGLMIDLSGMRTVRVDPAARRAVAAGGATWADFDAATQESNLATPGGFISHTGIAGLTLGGGLGHLTRKAGLSCDNLLGVELVTADSRVVRASESENPELFWAIRGGGGNFGVVTSFEYRLHQVGPLVNLGLLFWPIDQSVEALRLCARVGAMVPEDMGVFIGGLNLPPAPFVPEHLHLAPGVAVIVVGYGSAEEHAAAVAPIREVLAPTVELITPMPYTALQQMFDEGAPWGILGYEKALYLDDLSEAVIAVIAEHLPRKASPMSFMPVFSLGGAYGRAVDDATAFGGSRSAKYALNIAAIAPTPELCKADRAWVLAFWEALRPHATNSGSYVNFMSEYDENRVRVSYGAEKYDRLARVKAEYDPDNVFHLNANVKPTVAVR